VTFAYKGESGYKAAEGAEATATTNASTANGKIPASIPPAGTSAGDIKTAQAALKLKQDAVDPA